jgi:molybdenum cofactor sulfurtransferase
VLTANGTAGWRLPEAKCEMVSHNAMNATDIGEFSETKRSPDRFDMDMRSSGCGGYQVAAWLVMISLGLILFATFRCPLYEPDPSQYYLPIDSIAGEPYHIKILQHRAYNLNRLQNSVYLDYATKGLCPDSVISNVTGLLRTNLYGNTHSESPSSERSTNIVDDLRIHILKYLGTDVLTYSVVFTYSASHALKTFVEAFPFNASSTFLLAASSSDNLIGLRSVASDRHAKFHRFDLSESFDLSADGPNLIAFPLVDGFDGRFATRAEIDHILKLNSTFSLVDASLSLPFARLNLTETPFSAVTFGLEHWFGYPQLGVLVIDNHLIPRMQKPYFGGGTLVYALPGRNHEKLRMRPSEKFEDGSLPFLNLAAVESAFRFWEHLGAAQVRNHTETMSRLLVGKLRAMPKIVKVYGTNPVRIVTFNFLDKAGKVKRYNDFLASAGRNNIKLAGGCHGTPETCLRALGYKENDENVNISQIGALRASVGWATTETDLDRLCDWISSVADKF